MKRKVLYAAISSFLLIFNENILASNSVNVETSKFDLNKAADNAEQRYKNYFDIFDKNKDVYGFNVKLNSYNRNEKDAVAESSVTLDKDIIIKLRDTINYDENLWNKGIEAEIKSDIDLSSFLSFINNQEYEELINLIINNLSMSSKLLSNKDIEGFINLKDFSYGNVKEGKLDFGGIDVHIRFNEDEIKENPFVEQNTVNLSGLKFSDQEFMFEIEPFTIKYAYKLDNTRSITSNRIKMNFKEEETPNVSLSFEFDSKGKNLKFIPDIYNFVGFVGDVNTYLKNIFLNESVNIGTIELKQSNKLENNLFNITNELNFLINGKELMEMYPIIPFTINSISIKLGTDNVSVDSMKKLSSFVTNIQESDNDFSCLYCEFLKALHKDKSLLHIGLSANTDKGNIDINGDINIRANANISNEMLENENSFPEIFDFIGTVKIDESLLDAIGIKSQLETRLDSFVKKEGNKFIFDFSYTEKGLMLNGKSVIEEL